MKKMGVKNGCEKIADKLRNGKTHGHWIARSCNVLALLASGEKKYIPLIKSEVQKFCKADLHRGYPSWNYGIGTMMLAEYILVTGDKSFLKDLERITQEIVDGQSEVSTWGHSQASFSCPLAPCTELP